MNKEKLDTALSVFIADFRDWLPAKLAHAEIQQWAGCLPPVQRKTWQNATDSARKFEILIDIGPMAQVATDQPGILRSFWEGTSDDLQKYLKRIRDARNLSAHQSEQLKAKDCEDAFQAMVKVLDGFERAQTAKSIQALLQAFKTANNLGTSMMTATWKKKIKLLSATLYMEIAYQEKRKDIQDFLAAFAKGSTNYKGEHAELVRERLAVYFAKQGFIQGDELTLKGKQVRDTALVEATEIGKYQIWYTSQAPLLDTRILYFERQSPAYGPQNHTQKPRHGPLNLTSGHHFRLATEKVEAAASFRITQSGNPDVPQDFSSPDNHQSFADLVWRWDDSTATQLTLTAALDTDTKQPRIFPAQRLGMPIDTTPYLTGLFPDWRPQQKRLGIATAGLSIGVLRSFTQDFHWKNKLGFDQIDFKQVPLMPLDLQEAQRWRDALLADALLPHYLGQADWEARRTATNGLPGFLDFQLDSPEAGSFLQTHFGKTDAVNRGADFWHLAAPLDLFPTSKA
jgi:hypothetical protein